MSIIDYTSDEFTIGSTSNIGTPGSDVVFRDVNGHRYIDNIAYCKSASVRNARESGNPYVLLYLNDVNGKTRTFFYFNVTEDNRQDMITTVIEMRGKFIEISGEVELDSRGQLTNKLYGFKIHQGVRDYKKFLGSVDTAKYVNILNGFGEKIGFTVPSDWENKRVGNIGDDRYGAFVEFAYLTILNSSRIIIERIGDTRSEEHTKASILLALAVVFERGLLLDDNAALTIDILQVIIEMVKLNVKKYGMDDYQSDIIDAVASLTSPSHEPETILAHSMKLFYDYYLKSRELSHFAGTVTMGNPMQISFGIVKRG